MRKSGRWKVLAAAAAAALSMTACAGSADKPAETEAATEASEAVTEAEPSAPAEEETGIDLQWTAVGTGDAIQKGMDGEVDIVLVHSKAKEEEFVESGFGVERFQVMYNDFIIIGPKDGPVAATDDIESVFKQVKDEELTFVSRGDNSGTHNKETGIWDKLGIADYESNPNYVSAGAGMGDTINMTDEKGGYCLTDRGTWLAKKADYPDMVIICEGDANLLNQYGVIAVNPEKYPDLNNEAANTFIEWICSPEVQELIGAFGVEEYGEPLFFPNADQQ